MGLGGFNLPRLTCYLLSHAGHGEEGRGSSRTSGMATKGAWA